MSSVGSIDANIRTSSNSAENLDSSIKNTSMSEYSQPKCTQELQNKFNEIMNNDKSLIDNSLLDQNDNISLLDKSAKHIDLELLNKNQSYKNNELLSNKNNNVFSNSDNSVLNNKEDLSTIFSQLMTNMQNQNVSQNDLNIALTNVETASTSLQDAQKIINELVERILISDPDINGNQQVIIKLGKDSILEGTEIILTRALDGTLGVLINPKDRDQFKTLAEAKQDLELSLQQHEKGIINVTINDSAISNL